MALLVTMSVIFRFMDFPVSLWQSILTSKPVLSRGGVLSLFLHMNKILDAPKISACFCTVVTCYCNIHLQTCEQHTHLSFSVFALFLPLTLLSYSFRNMCACVSWWQVFIFIVHISSMEFLIQTHFKFTFVKNKQNFQLTVYYS